MAEVWLFCHRTLVYNSGASAVYGTPQINTNPQGKEHADEEAIHRTRYTQGKNRHWPRICRPATHTHLPRNMATYRRLPRSSKPETTKNYEPRTRNTHPKGFSDRVYIYIYLRGFMSKIRLWRKPGLSTDSRRLESVLILILLDAPSSLSMSQQSFRILTKRLQNLSRDN